MRFHSCRSRTRTGFSSRPRRQSIHHLRSKAHPRWGIKGTTVLTRPDKAKLHTLLGNYPNVIALKDGRIGSDLVEFDFPDYPIPNRGFKPLVREHKFDLGELAIVTFLQAKSFGAPYVLLPATVMG